MLITNGVDDHPMKGPGTSVHNPACCWRWTFACYGHSVVQEPAPRAGKAKHVRVPCTRLRVVSCAHDRHILLEQAIRIIETEGWRLAAPSEDGGGYRCPEHA